MLCVCNNNPPNKKNCSVNIPQTNKEKEKLISKDKENEHQQSIVMKIKKDVYKNTTDIKETEHIKYSKQTHEKKETASSKESQEKQTVNEKKQINDKKNSKQNQKADNLPPSLVKMTTEKKELHTAL